MHIWEIVIQTSIGQVLLRDTVNPISGSEGKDMVFRCPGSSWLNSGYRAFVQLLKDGVHVAEEPLVSGLPMVTRGVKFSAWDHTVQASAWIRPPTDTWELFIESKNQEELATIPLIYVSGQIGDEVEFKFATFHWKNSGQIGTFHYLKNGKPVARFVAYPETVTYGSVCPAGTVYVKPEEWLPDASVVKKEPVCDCGGWATYGKDANLHEDTRFFTCSLVKKV